MPDVRAYPAHDSVGSPSRRRGRRRGVEIRPGSVKQARAEAGLSLGQVAQGDISRTAIYFVETGKAKPSIETLQLIATRTNKPVDFFLAGGAGINEAALAEVERQVAVGDNAAAIVAGDALLARNPSPQTAAHARLLMSNALVRTGQPARGRSLAMAARNYFEQVGDTLMTAECLSWEAGAAQMMQDPAALGLIEQALERCHSLTPEPTVIKARLLAILGHVHVSRHEYAKAIQAYEQALSVGAAFPDLRRLSYVYGNLSLAYQELGQYAQAVHYSRRAMNVLEALRDRLAIAFTQNNLACLLFKQGDIDAALRNAQASLQTIEELGVESGTAHVLMTLAELELAQNHFAAAEQYASAAVDRAQRTGETVNVGESHVWLGRIAAAQGDDARSDQEFAVAFDKFDAVEAADWQARGHVVYADILEARGDLVGANREMRKALAALGMSPVVPRIAMTAIA